MKHLSVKSLFALGLFAALFSFNACQKEAVQLADSTVKTTTTTDRGPGGALMYGVTVFSAGNPSQLVEIDLATGNVQNTLPVFLINSSNAVVPIDDLKGICCVNGQLFATTGPNAVDAYNNMLIKINPQTGQAGVISYAPTTISDIDYDVNTGIIYGLRNNSNTLYSIQNVNNNNWATYANLGAIGNMGSSVAKGLSVVRDQAGLRLIVAGTQALGGNALLFQVPFGGGNATALTAVQPAANLAAGHCGIGFDIGNNAMYINRNAAAFGLNSFAWQNAFGANTNSAIWGNSTSNFEDLTTNL